VLGIPGIPGTRTELTGRIPGTAEAFTYDPVGNRLTSHLSASLEDAEFTYTYDANSNR